MSIVQRANQFFQSVWVESKKVTWPTRAELRESTTVVIVATFILMVYIFAVDRVLNLALSVFL